MARPRELIPGNCYFTLFYYDTDLVVPSIQTLIYRGVDKYDDDGRRVWLFEEPSGEDASEAVIRFGFPDDQLHMILDLAGLLRGLAGISDFHPFKPPSASQGEIGISDEARRELRTQILAFTSDPECSATTATILFTDDALSLGKRKEGGFEMGFFPKPKIGNSDKRILDFFAERGVLPHVDYLADSGRTRALKFAMPGDTAAIENLCASILVEVFGIRHDDVLRFNVLGRI
jgi:hypothetical protein